MLQLLFLGCIFEKIEIPDGGRVNPGNQPCNICTCNKGVITCEIPPCNCSTWSGGEDREICCPQCDPRESCKHQEMQNVVFESGAQWIYQCQTCECLVKIQYLYKNFFLINQLFDFLIFFLVWRIRLLDIGLSTANM